MRKILNFLFWVAVGLTLWSQAFSYLDRLTAPEIHIEYNEWERETPHWDLTELERVKEI